MRFKTLIFSMLFFAGYLQNGIAQEGQISYDVVKDKEGKPCIVQLTPMVKADTLTATSADLLNQMYEIDRQVGELTAQRKFIKSLYLKLKEAEELATPIAPEPPKPAEPEKH